MALQKASRRVLAASVACLLAGVATGAADVTAKRRLPGPGRITVGAAEFLAPRGPNAPSAPIAPSPGNNLRFGGGEAVGATSAIIATPAVYLTFWGSQWSPDDPMAVYEEQFLQGLYGPGDTWTSVASQYCQGGGIAWKDQRCPAGSQHVGRPDGPLVKGVWFDSAVAAKPLPTATVVKTEATYRAGNGIVTEAMRAAAHFGNLTPEANLNAIYLVMTPLHFSAHDYGTYCAYHASATSSYGTVVFAQIPYLPALGPGCGQNAVNRHGTFDGVSIVVGHEYMEMLTNPRPTIGWADSRGDENGDKCAWLKSGRGAMANLHLATGRFAVQSTWSNAASGCVLHP